MAERTCNSGVYRIVNLENGKSYVGSTTDFDKRWSTHRRALARGKHGNRYLQAAVDLHGAAAFHFYVLEFVPCFTDLVSREQHYIDLYAPEYNLRILAGSQLGMKHTPETLEKIRQASLQQRHSPETLAKMSAAQKKRANRPWNKALMRDQMSLFRKMGVVVAPPDSPEKRAKTAERNRQRVWTQEQRDVVSRRRRGVKASEEARRKMRENSSHHPNPPGHVQHMIEVKRSIGYLPEWSEATSRAQKRRYAEGKGSARGPGGRFVKRNEGE